MRERLLPLRSHDRDVLLCAAAVGSRFDLDLLVELHRSTPARVRAALRAGSNLQLIEPIPGETGRYQFRHALMRDAIYAELVAARLQPLHREIGAALERLAARRPANLDDLAYHWWAAGDAARGARYNEAAGDRAAALHAPEEARTSYRRALDLLPRSSSALRARLEAKAAALDDPR